jgi:AcrR family transcriptional regulator
MVEDMIHAPDPGPRAPASRSDYPKGLRPAVVTNGAAKSKAALRTAGVQPLEPREPTLVDQAGRALGPRALQTRQRILDAVVSLLEEKPMRDLRVIDIARRVGSSPATFYQYFKDVEDVVLHLACVAAEQTHEMVDLIHGDWSGREGHERARRLVNLVIDHWKKYAPILRVRNNATDEGDPRFREVRRKALMPMLEAFEEEIERAHGAADVQAHGVVDAPTTDDGEWEGGRINSTVGATAITSILERLAMYHVAIEEMVDTREDLVETAATIVQSVMASRR